MKKSFLVSIVVPVHNEEGNVDPLIIRLKKSLVSIPFELLFINDGSTDATFEILKQKAHEDKRIKIISLTRNFGHQNALMCGYSHVTGDCSIAIDADLQDPPELIPRMIDKWQQGADIVYAKRKTRNDTFFKKLTAYWFYRLLNFLSDTPIPADVGDYRLQDARVTQYLADLPEHNKFIRGLVAWGGFKEDSVYIDRDARHSGKTHYPLTKMVNFALDGIISFSTKPLRIATYTGFVTSLLGSIGIIYAIYRRLFLSHEYWTTGWTGLIVAVLFMGGIQLITIGIIGEYIAKMYRETQNRPSYLIGEKINI
ncbi:glycosyltransferase [Candidatus Roizmanbacteria bacterium CG10_big_fil_rev_8_21_14_0_10_45_7]|uniref:Glycosyltransferase n=1 Tax=Candidatus Roizmanbacteria bacterium CG10_big_fil_rev_8_21_14_0_10_45_7 TaxID=1974854 RepID=A0A2M8KU47_9BACT|nr:MAG: glycosyltransferase [Candidatus Roizmanbacteria bacterium CG10_big_fil_rev_8_21_14_0_10_45_7]